MDITNISFSIGDIDEAIDIIREAAGWLIEIGRPLWNLEDLTKEKMLKDSKIDDIYVFKVNNESAGAMILKWQDTLFWPNIKYGESGYIHKLSIRRKFASTGFSIKMVDQAINECKKRYIPLLRLDCDANRENLCDFYEKLGFIRVDRRMMGIFDVAFYEYDVVKKSA